MKKPILFLDFDYTLFDTAQLYVWLGDAIEARIFAIEQGTLELPDCTSMLYPDTIAFLVAAKKTHRLVLLTCTIHPFFQKTKVDHSGVVPYLDDVLITEGVRGNSGKAIAAKDYLRHMSAMGKNGHVFVDDTSENISEMKMLNPEVRNIEIRRPLRRPDSTPSSLELRPPDDKVTDLTELLRLLV